MRAFNNTYDLKTLITNCSNNYGPNQYAEKLIPLIIKNICNNVKLPIYGKGINIRDWLYVLDHVDAIDLVFHKGKAGDTYNIGGDNEWTNIDLVKKVIQICDRKLKRTKGSSLSLIDYVDDRLGHDLRYAIDFNKINSELGWKPKHTFQEGIEKTIDWYLINKSWFF